MVKIDEILDQVADLKPLAIKVLLVLVAILAIAVVVLGLYCRTIRLERELALDQVADLSRVVDDVNHKVAEWKAAADRQAKAAAEAQALAVEIRVQGERRIAELEGAKIPAECSEAVRWGADQVLRSLGGGK